MQLTTQYTIYTVGLACESCPVGFNLGHDRDHEFQGQVYILLYISQKGPNCHETKSKHIDWTLGLKSVTNRINLGHDLDLKFFRSNTEFAGVMICRIVTGVTSDIGVPWTRLVFRRRHGPLRFAWSKPWLLYASPGHPHVIVLVHPEYFGVGTIRPS